MNLDQLQKIAEAATPGPWTPLLLSCGADVRAPHPSGGSTWVAETRCNDDAAYIAAFDPPTVLRLIAVARAAKAALSLRDERVHITTTERSAATRTEELLRNGEAAEQAWAAIRSALSDLDAQQEPTNG